MIKKLKNSAFMGQPMRKRLRMLVWITRAERKMVCIFSFFEFISLISTLGLTLLLLIYFDKVPAVLNTIHPIDTLTKHPVLTVTLCVAVSASAFAAKLSQGIIEARVTSNREFWYSEYIRKLPKLNPTRKVPTRELARGSHYYGRLAGSVLQIVASALIFIVTYVLLLVILTWKGVLITIAITIALALIGAILSLFIGRRLKNSAVGLIAQSRPVALWKGDSNIATGLFVNDYYKQYFYRIFLVGVFGYANLLFAFTFMIVLWVNEQAQYFEVKFETVFIIYMVAQIYLGNIARFISNLVKTAAFLPFVEPVMDV